jgi:hypothetical protein
MANFKARDYRDQEIYLSTSGAGTDASPLVLEVGKTRVYQTVAMQTAAVALGNGTSVLCIATTNVVTALTMQVVGITAGSAIVSFEATLDNTNWVSVKATNVTTGALSPTAEEDGIYRLSCSGFLRARARISSYTSGSVTITGIATESE